MISHAHRTIFVHIQKTGGTSVTAAFGQPINAPDKHHRADQLRERLGAAVWDSYFTFAFVRNPWDRLVSWWSMIDAMRPRLDSGAPLNAFSRYVLRSARSFEEFLLHATEEIVEEGGAKSITRCQTDYLVDSQGRLLVDFVGRFETLEADFSRIAARLPQPPAPLRHMNRSRRSDYRQYYTPRLADLVAARFSKDIERFGYRFGEAAAGHAPQESPVFGRASVNSSASASGPGPGVP
ncbi:sulfotransferase family 2 domain-containing protein [Falsiroseomonas selenitidurans]|uniref:sulfotransferase family 2 domain-containing protein n=1 Tax=Falsiroseomonas selenitidurans TaxID=2716335 RepID=UPI00143B4D2D|nr:sulfotransferase family 2 domain-containing protein [Falsiroseomonas selenitidurans]